MLEHQAAIHEVERASSEPPKVRSSVDLELAQRGRLVIGTRERNHRIRHIDANHLVEGGP